MKKILSIFLVTVISCVSVFANDVPNWNGLILIADYDTSSEEIIFHFEVPAAKDVSNDYYLNVFLGSKKYRKTFNYNAGDKVLEADFSIQDSSLDDSYPLSVSIQDVHFNEVFQSSADLVLGESNTSSNNENTYNSIIPTSSFGLNTGNTGQNYSVTDLYYRDSVIPTNSSVWFYTPSNTPVISESQSVTPINPVVIPTSVTPIIVNPSSSNTIKYTPKYPNRASEPSVINGIGNSKSYSSWRAR